MRTTGRMMARQLPFRKDGATPLGKSIALETCGTRQTIFLGQKIKACVYRAKLQEHAGHLLSFQLRSNKGPWRLLALEVS